MMKRRQLLLLNERRLSIIVFALFSSWMLALPFEGQILYAIARRYDHDPQGMIFGSIAAIGLSFIAFLVLDRSVSSYLLINTLMLGACGVCDRNNEYWPGGVVIWTSIVVSAVRRWHAVRSSVLLVEPVS